MHNRVLDHKLRQSMTFRQAEGLEPIPGPLNFLELDNLIRGDVWDVVFMFLEKHRRGPYDHSILENPAREYVRLIYRKICDMPMDQAHRSSQYFRNAEATLKNIIFERKSDVVLEFLQVSLRSHELPMSETTKLIEVIESPRTAYKVIYNPATIVSLGSPLERDRVASDLEFVSKSNLAGAYSHLRKAGEELSKGQNRSTVREAILSVESAAKHITNNPSATLADALKQLQQTHPLHTAFKQGLEKLYAYTNDEKGIRHALIESENDRVGIEEAIFMFSACAAFVSYLIRKSLAEVSSTSGPAEKAVPLQ